MFEIINETKEEISELDVINTLILNVVKQEKIEEAIFNVIIINNEKIKELNKMYRGIDKETDVISFALEDNNLINLDIRILGDVYISLDKAKVQAEDYNHSLLRELSFLTVHGILHLLGYDHMSKDDEKVMFLKQEQILNELGIKR